MPLLLIPATLIVSGLVGSALMKGVLKTQDYLADRRARKGEIWEGPIPANLKVVN
jgi:hypothetical protein